MRTYIILFLVLFTACKQRGRGTYTTRIQNNETSPNNNINSLKDSAPIPGNNKKHISGKVIKVTDGDTFTLLLNNDFDTKVRLNGIDCPEKKQAYSKKAKDRLSHLIFGKNIDVYYEKKDGFGRVLGDVYVNKINVNQDMVQNGLAWHFKEYSNDPILEKLEQEAIQNRVGLWIDSSPIPPWEFRKRSKNK